MPINSIHDSLVGTSLIHLPINGTYLFTDRNYLPSITLNEIIRLKPSGEGLPAQIFLIGRISNSIERQLNSVGFTTYRLEGMNIFETATISAHFRLRILPTPNMKHNEHMKHHHSSSDKHIHMKDGHKPKLFIVSAENPYEALPAAYYAAHEGVPILFVTRDNLPEETIRSIKEYTDGLFTIFGSCNSISKEIEEKIRKIAKHVDRVEGETPYEISVNFAKREENHHQIGWERTKKGQGDAFTFATIYNWPLALAGLLFAHHGKHTPLLLIEPDKVPKVVKDYLKLLRPEKMDPKPPFMHGFILGPSSNINYDTQIKIEELIMLKMMD